MGYDFDQDPKYNSEKYVSIKIELNKKCYNPGEFITGLIILSPKPGILNSNFSDPTIIFTISQYEYISLGDDYLLKQDDKILNISLYLSNYIGANLLTTINIPFSIQIPIVIAPTFIVNRDIYCRHFLTVHIPSIESKKSLLIIIKSAKNFTIENKLFKSPATVFKEIRKCSFLVSKGKIACYLKTTKNSWDYNEEIPVELTLNCSNIKMPIYSVIISIIRQIKVIGRLKNIIYNDKKSIVSEEYKLDKNQELYILQKTFKFPTFSDYTSVFPPTVYQLVELENQDTLFKEMNKYTLCPEAKAKDFAIEYYLNAKIVFDELFTYNEDVEIPLDFYDSSDGENIDDYPIKNENKNKNKIININDFNDFDDFRNNNISHRSKTSDYSAPPIPRLGPKFIDINDLGDSAVLSSQKKKEEEDKLKETTNLSFEIIDESDFYNALTKKNNKKE